MSDSQEPVAQLKFDFSDIEEEVESDEIIEDIKRSNIGNNLGKKIMECTDSLSQSRTFVLDIICDDEGVEVVIQ